MLIGGYISNEYNITWICSHAHKISDSMIRYLINTLNDSGERNITLVVGNPKNPYFSGIQLFHIEKNLQNER